MARSGCRQKGLSFLCGNRHLVANGVCDSSGLPLRRALFHVAQRPQRAVPPGGHSSQSRHGRIDVVVNANLGLRDTWTMEPAGVLGERPSPRNRHREEECVEPRIVETFADVASSREHDALATSHSALESIATRARRHASVKDNAARRDVAQAPLEQLEMVAALGQDEG